MNKTVKNIFRTAALLTGILLLALSLFVLIKNYDDFIRIILERVGKYDKADKFKTEYLSFEKFLFIRIVLTVFTVSYWGIMYRYSDYLFEKIYNLYVFIYAGIESEIRSISKSDWSVFWVILIISSGIKLYCFFTQPISNDEAFTFLNYVRPGFAAALSYYNLTNNHILHSLFCNIFDLLPISPVYSLRITSFISGLFVLFASFLLFNKLLNSKAKFIALVFFAFTLPNLQYGFLARGYSLLLLFSILSTFVLLKLLKASKQLKKLWATYILLSTLGFYSIPVYIYVFTAQIVFFIFALTAEKRKNRLKDLAIASMITTVLTFILYSPIIIISGLNSLIGNKYVQAIEFNEFLKLLPEFISGYFIWLSSNNINFSIFSILVIFIALFYSYRQKRVVFILIISFLLTPIIITALQQIASYYRLLIFNTLSLALSYGLFAEYLIKKINISKKIQLSLLLMSTLLMIAISINNFNNSCKYEKEKNLKAYHFADLIKNNSEIFSTNQVRYYTFLKFKAMYLDKKQIKLFRKNFKTDYPYDYISEDKSLNEQFTKYSKYKYTLIYEDKYIRLFERE